MAARFVKDVKIDEILDFPGLCEEISLEIRLLLAL